MYSGISMAFSSLFFGFSVNFYMAVVFRYLTGLTNGNAHIIIIILHREIGYNNTVCSFFYASFVTGFQKPTVIQHYTAKQ